MGIRVTKNNLRAQLKFAEKQIQERAEMSYAELREEWSKIFPLHQREAIKNCLPPSRELMEFQLAKSSLWEISRVFDL